MDTVEVQEIKEPRHRDGRGYMRMGDRRVSFIKNGTVIIVPMRSSITVFDEETDRPEEIQISVKGVAKFNPEDPEEQFSVKTGVKIAYVKALNALATERVAILQKYYLNPIKSMHKRISTEIEAKGIPCPAADWKLK